MRPRQGQSPQFTAGCLHDVLHNGCLVHSMVQGNRDSLAHGVSLRQDRQCAAQFRMVTTVIVADVLLGGLGKAR